MKQTMEKTNGMKKLYERPSMTTVAMESELMTIGGSQNPGSNNGQAGDAKGNNFIFDEEEEEDN